MATQASDVGSKLLAWLMAGAGTLLAYSAYKNRAPWDVLRDIQGRPIDSTTGSTVSGYYSPSVSMGSEPTANFSTSVPRIRMVANREIPPTLVNIRPSGQLDKDAAASLNRVFAKLGKVIGNTSAYRSFSSQADSYYNRNERLSDGSMRFGSPSRSLHVVGLAIDLNAYEVTPEVIAAMKSEGWQHPRPAAEPWHFSYLVRG